MDTTDLEAEGATREQVFERMDAGQVTVGQGYADEAEIEVGDTLVLEGPSGTRRAEVAAIVETVFAGGPDGRACRSRRCARSSGSPPIRSSR